MKEELSLAQSLLFIKPKLSNDSYCQKITREEYLSEN
jgi:hypothetical protein